MKAAILDRNKKTTINVLNIDNILVKSGQK